MAELSLVMGYAHTPYLFGPPGLWPQIRNRVRQGKPVREDLPRETAGELEAKYVRCMNAFAALRERLASARCRGEAQVDSIHRRSADADASR